MFQRTLLCCSVLLMAAETCQGATFTRLGTLPTGELFSSASGISGGGTTIVGNSLFSELPLIEATQWTSAGIISPLGTIPPDNGSSRFASATSLNGGIIVGGINQLEFGPSEAFRWTAAEGFVNLGFLPGFDESNATDVSASGETIVGGTSISGGNGRAYRWTSDTGMVSLGTLTTNTINASSGAAAISADGSVIVGTSSSGDDASEAFLWTETSGMVGLGELPGGFVGSSAHGISADGSTVVGDSNSGLTDGSSLEAFFWTQANGIQGLGFLDSTDVASIAQFASAEGQLIFGDAISNDEGSLVFRTFVWDQQRGMRNLVDVLDVEFGLGSAVAGWTQFRAADISDDGLSLVGSGTNPDGNSEAWLIQLDHPIGVPEPASVRLLLAVVSASFFVRRRWVPPCAGCHC